MRAQSGHGYIYFASKEYETSSLRPRLSITYTIGNIQGFYLHLPFVHK